MGVKRVSKMDERGDGLKTAQRAGLLALVVLGCLGAAPQTAWRELTADEIISADSLRKLQTDHADFLLFDARGKKSYDEAHIEGAVLPLKADYYSQEEANRTSGSLTPLDPEAALTEVMSLYPKDKWIVTYCNSNCKAAAALLMKLKSHGFTRVQAMEEGIQGWESKGYPVVRAAASS